VGTLDEYGAPCHGAGFEIATLDDITQQRLRSYLRHMVDHVPEDWLDVKCDYDTMQVALRSLYILCAAIKANSSKC
jgi:hypothetical protein